MLQVHANAVERRPCLLVEAELPVERRLTLPLNTQGKTQATSASEAKQPNRAYT